MDLKAEASGTVNKAQETVLNKKAVLHTETAVMNKQNKVHFGSDMKMLADLNKAGRQQEVDLNMAQQMVGLDMVCYSRSKA